MKSSDLHKVWSATDNSRLTSKQYSFRLPVHVAAKLSALEEMYPNRTRTEIVCDLLAAALDGVERSFPGVKGAKIGRDDDTREMVYEDVGLGLKFQRIANRHYKALEKELGNKDAAPLYPEKLHGFEKDFAKDGA
jgi:hypothetical protein